MANLQLIFFGNARQSLRHAAFCLAAVVLAAGCAAPDSRTPPPPGTVPAPASSPGANSSVATGTQSNVLTGPISVEAAIAQATRCSPQIIALEAAVEVAKQRKSAASDIPDPEGIVTWGKVANDFTDTGAASDGNRLGVRLYVPNPFLMVPKVNAGTANFQAGVASLHAAKWLVENDVRRLFAEIQYLGDGVNLAADLAHQYELILQDERARESQGAATAAEIVTAVHREVAARHDLNQARYRWQSAQRELAGMLRLDVAAMPLQLTTNATDFHPPAEPAASFERVLQIASQHRNDLVALRWRTLAAKSAYVEARNVRVPWVKDVGVTHRDSGDDWWLGIAVNVPIFSWTINNTAGVQQAEVKLAEANEANGAQLMRREVSAAMDEFTIQQRQQERDQKELAPLLSEMRQTLELLKRSPSTLPSQVAATEAQIIESLRLKLESDWLYQRAALDLERAVGMPLSIALNTN